MVSKVNLQQCPDRFDKLVLFLSTSCGKSRARNMKDCSSVVQPSMIAP
uniref:Uncharacterized protein n=1 Tax=Anguilla anguilla TaxID=7936 RepID=A0A0E9SFU0_ANGAN